MTTMQKQTKYSVQIKLSHQKSGMVQASSSVFQGVGSPMGRPSKNQVMARPSLEGNSQVGKWGRT